MRKNNPKRNICLVILESAATAGTLAIPIMTPFYLSIGLDQKQIALTQMVFTIVTVLLNLPLGWVADRFSRKWANVVGDGMVVVALLLYSMASDFWSIVLCEIFFGFGSAMSQGVDSTLLKHFAEKKEYHGSSFKELYGKLISIKQATTLIFMLLGGPIGAVSFRLAIACSAIPYAIGVIVGLLIQDDSEKLAAEKNPFYDIVMLVKRNFSNCKLRLYVTSFAIAREITHGIVWVFTPMLLAVGMPMAIVSVGWVVNYVAVYVGTLIARRYARKLPAWKLFAVPILLVSVASLIMFCNLNAITVFFYACFGLAQGWSSVTMMPLIKEQVKATEQSSVESLAHVTAQMLYIVTVWIVNWAADIETRYALIATIGVFVPLAIPVIVMLRKER